MTTVDNFNVIRGRLAFNNPNEFYFVQILQRKKDGNQGLHVRNGYRLIKSYYIYSLEEYDSLIERIKELCESNNARAYINVNVRNAQEVALECIRKYAELVQNNSAFQGNDVWNRSCGSARARGYKAFWIVDVDTKDQTVLNTVVEIIKGCRHNETFDLFIVPTVNGNHVICNGFDVSEFAKKLRDIHYDKIDIHKDNPTLLYYNDLSCKQEQTTI